MKLFVRCRLSSDLLSRVILSLKFPHDTVSILSVASLGLGKELFKYADYKKDIMHID